MRNMQLVNIAKPGGACIVNFGLRHKCLKLKCIVTVDLLL